MCEVVLYLLFGNDVALLHGMDMCKEVGEFSPCHVGICGQYVCDEQLVKQL